MSRNGVYVRVLLVVVAIVGLGSITAAVVAGVLYTTLQVAVTSLPTRYAGLVAVLFGLATLSYTRHPEGFLDVLSGRAQLLIADRRSRRLRSGPSDSGTGPEPGDGHTRRSGGAGRSVGGVGEPDPVVGGPVIGGAG